MRRILLVLDESVTDTGCRTCRFSRADTGPMASGELFCGAYGLQHLRFARGEFQRLPECLAAEAATERCVEIDPGDAASLRDEMLRCDFDMRLIGTPGERAADAIDQHAAKARGGKP